MDSNSIIYAVYHIVIFSPFLVYAIYKKLTHPIILFIGVLSFQYIIYQFFQDRYNNYLLINTIDEIFLGLWAFLFGYIFISIVSILVRQHYKIKLSPNFYYVESAFFLKNKNKIKLLTAIVIIGHIIIGFNNGINGVYDSFLVNVRMVHVENPGSFFVFPHIAIFLQSWFVYCIIHGHEPRSAFIYLILVTFFCALAKLERSSIISIIITLLVLKDQLSYKGVSIKAIVISLVTIISIFVFVASQFYTSGSFLDLLFVFLDYFAKNLDTFNRFVVNMQPTYNLSLILGPFTRLFASHYEMPDINTDGSFNTYSYLMNLHLFGGVVFVIIFNALIGALFSFFYEVRYSFNGAFLGFFAFFSCSLFLSFFAYTFSWSNWLYYALSFLLIHLMMRRFTGFKQKVN